MIDEIMLTVLLTLLGGVIMILGYYTPYPTTSVLIGLIGLILVVFPSVFYVFRDRGEHK